jgi:hypothetical protein
MKKYFLKKDNYDGEILNKPGRIYYVDDSLFDGEAFLVDIDDGTGNSLYFEADEFHELFIELKQHRKNIINGV